MAEQSEGLRVDF